MIRLTLKQMDEALRAAHDLSEAVRAKDELGSRESFLASATVEVPSSVLFPLGRMSVDVLVDRATVLAPIIQRRDDAAAKLAALGIELDPAGGQQ